MKNVFYKQKNMWFVFFNVKNHNNYYSYLNIQQKGDVGPCSATREVSRVQTSLSSHQHYFGGNIWGVSTWYQTSWCQTWKVSIKEQIRALIPSSLPEQIAAVDPFDHCQSFFYVSSNFTFPPGKKSSLLQEYSSTTAPLLFLLPTKN